MYPIEGKQRACLDPACGDEVELKEVWQGDERVVLRAALHFEVLASKSCEPTCDQRLLAIRAHEGPCAAHGILWPSLLQSMHCVSG